MATVNGLVNTSADDCKISLRFVTDLELLREALRVCQIQGHTTKVKHISSRIRQIEKGITC